MKKILLLLALLSTSGLIYAQDSGFELGVKTGLNNTWIFNNNAYKNNDNHKEHFNVKPLPIGVTVGYKVTDQSSIMMEAFWSKQGANYDLKDANGKKVGEKEIKLEYLVVPILFKFTGEGETRFAMQLGGQIAFLLEGNETNILNQDVTITNQNVPYNGQTIPAGTYLLATTDAAKQTTETGKFNKKDYNAVADFGVEHDFNEKCYLSAGLRLTCGFKDIRAGESQVSKYDLDKYTLRYNATAGIHVGVHWFL